ncbi:LysR family transcriptional regulator [Geothrix limicola]|uniref:LysR family transcriptional regulator n=2 Tax=Geothrix limicola TaxID=2927978 RepID=A0ABQ5QE61_9BACT|nr:LysR family transcriptional regulator [Geothrix limicola]
MCSMNATQIDFQLLVVFAAVAEQNSFTKASRKLGIGKGTVSRSIAQLEGLLGFELLHRTTHKVALSTAGAALYERTREHLAELQRALVDLPERDEEPSGVLRMTAPQDFGTIVLPPIFAAFARRYPAVQLEVRLMGPHSGPVREGYDLAIRVATGPLKDSSLTVRRITRIPVGIYASPSYLARRGRPRDKVDERHSWVVHLATIRLLKTRPLPSHFVVDDFLFARELIREGVGLGLLPLFVAKDYVREGFIEEVSIPGRDRMEGEIVILYPSSGQVPKKVIAFANFVIDAFRSHSR